jgi:hypothetical protein
MRLQLRRPPPKSQHPVSAGYSDMLATAANWEVVGAISFNGRAYLLVFVDRKTCWQVGVEVFEPSEREIPAHWRMATGLEDRLPKVQLLLGHPLLVSDPGSRCRKRGARE